MAFLPQVLMLVVIIVLSSIVTDGELAGVHCFLDLYSVCNPSHSSRSALQDKNPLEILMFTDLQIVNKDLTCRDSKTDSNIGIWFIYI